MGYRFYFVLRPKNKNKINTQKMNKKYNENHKRKTENGNEMQTDRTGNSCDGCGQPHGDDMAIGSTQK